MSSLSKGCEKSESIEELVETRLLIVRSALICNYYAVLGDSVTRTLAR